MNNLKDFEDGCFLVEDEHDTSQLHIYTVSYARGYRCVYHTMSFMRDFADELMIDDDMFHELEQEGRVKIKISRAE